MKALGRVTLLSLAFLLALFSPTGTPARAAGEGEIVIPAISFSAQGGGEVDRREPRGTPAEPDPGYVHFWHTPGHWLEWTLDGAAPGEYEVTLRYAGKHTVERSVSVNGAAVKGLDPVPLPRTGRWSEWRETTLPARVTLREGRNVLRMTCDDAISLRLSDITLKDSAGKTLAAKAALFSSQGGGQVQILKAPTLGYVTNWRSEGHWLEWSVDAAKAGRYAARLHYSADGYCRIQVQVNGQAVKGLEDVIPPYTGDDSYWTPGTLAVSLVLKSGRNALRITTLGGKDRGVPALGGEFGLSAIRLAPLAADAAVAGDVLALLRPQDVARPEKEPPDIPPAPLGPPLAEVAGAVPLEAGRTIDLAGTKATIATADVVPYVENKFSKRFIFANYDNPELRRFREKYQLEKVIAGGKDEFEKQVLLMKWVWDQWDFGHGMERYYLTDPFEIVDFARQEHKFQCMHSGAVLQTAANSLGWVARQMAIPSHTFNEIWSNQHRKWVQFDATSNYFPEKNGVPLTTYEHRQALHREGGGVMRAFMTDAGLQRKAQRDSYKGRLLFIGYIPNTNNLVRGPMYGNDRFFITKDELCEGRGWHTRDCPEDPATEPYFPINQAALALVPDGDAIRVTLGTMTPNFMEFRVRTDGGRWKPSANEFTWTLRAGENRLEAMSVNKFGAQGPVSTLVIQVDK